MKEARHQHIVYFLHAENEGFCKIGRTTVAGLSKRRRNYEKSKDTSVRVIGYRFCRNEEEAEKLEKELLNKFDRIGNQELVMIDPELVDYIWNEAECPEELYLALLVPIPDYDEFDEADKQKVKAYADKVHSARKSHEQTERRLEDARKAEEKARQECLAIQQKQDRYLAELARTLREQGWTIKKISEFTGQSENEVKNWVYKHKPPGLF